MSMMLLPPAKDKCQECATAHAPDEPHNAQSLYYQMRFTIEKKRAATWNDAVAHCDAEVQRLWLAELKKMGVDVDKGELAPKVSRKRLK